MTKLTLSILSALLLGSFTPANEPRQKAAAGSLQISYDKRVETLYFVLMLTGDYDVLISQHPTSYKSAVLKNFSKHKDHKAVGYAKRLIANGFGFDYAANWIFQFSDFPEFQKVNEVNFPFSLRELSADTLELFRKELRNFYADAKCDSFFMKQTAFLDEMISRTKNSISGKNLPAMIEQYYGVKKNAEFRVILSPLMHSGGYGIENNKANGQKELLAVIGPNGEIRFSPLFDNDFLEKDLIIHEFGHSYANDIVDAYKSSLKKYEDKLYPKISEDMENEGVGKESFLYELIVRAVTIRIVEQNYGKEAADELAEYEESIGFSYVKDVADELKNYEKQRDKYPGLKDFFPEIIKRLEKVQ